MSISNIFRERSLAISIFAVLAIGLFLIQILSFNLVSRMLEAQTRQKMFSFMEADIAFIGKVLEDTPHADRQAMMKHINRGFYSMTLRNAPIENPIISRERFENLYKVSDKTAELLGVPPLNWVWVGSYEDSRPALILPLDQDQVLEVDATDPIPALSKEAFTIYLFGIFVAVSLFALLALRIALKPLKRLVKSAERLGRDLKTPIHHNNEPYEIRNLAIVLEKMRRRILSEFDRHTQMLAAISHDMQTPITRVMLRVDAIQQEDVKQKITDDLKYMSDLISKSLEYGRTSLLRIESRPLNINALIELFVDEMKDLGFRLDVIGSINEPLWGNLNELRRAIQNILDNAFKYGKDVQIELGQNYKDALIVIRDSGPGIPEVHMTQIGRPFFRPDGSRSQSSGGSGLGISITMNIIAAHKGVVSLKNRPNGLEVRIEIPLGPPKKGSSLNEAGLERN